MRKYQYKQLVELLLRECDMNDDHIETLEEQCSELQTIAQTLEDKHKQLKEVRLSIDIERNDLIKENDLLKKQLGRSDAP